MFWLYLNQTEELRKKRVILHILPLVPGVMQMLDCSDYYTS